MNKFLKLLLGVVLCIGLSFGLSRNTYAEIYMGSHGVAKPALSYAYISGSANYNNTTPKYAMPLTTYGSVASGWISAQQKAQYSYLNYIRVNLASSIPYNSIMNFTVSIYAPGKTVVADFAGLSGDSGVSILEQDIEEYAEGFVINVTAINMAGANTYFNLGSADGFIANISGNTELNIAISAISWVGVYDGATMHSLLAAMQNDIQTSRNTLADILKSLGGIDISGIVNTMNKNQQQNHEDAQKQLEAIQNQTDAIQQGNQQQQQQWQAEQDKADDSVNDSSGQDSSAQAEQASESLLKVVIDFWGAVTSATPTNCKVSLPFPDFTKMGNFDLDFCSNPINFPPVLHAIVALLVIVPASVFWFNKIYAQIMGLFN